MIDPAKFAAFAPRALPGTREALEAAAAKSGIIWRFCEGSSRGSGGAEVPNGER